jgi:acetyltransferase-like isoleucine patch superfamily enzyme
MKSFQKLYNKGILFKILRNAKFMSFLLEHQIREIGFKSVGENVKISCLAHFFNPKNIQIGNNCRIDAFSILYAGEGGILFGDYIHLAAYVSLQGSEKIELKNFCGLSSRVTVYSSSDDFSGNFLTGPCVPEKFRGVVSKSVLLEDHVIVGAGSIILPGVKISAGSAIGAMSLVSKDIPGNSIYSGIPAKFIKERSSQIFHLEHEFLKRV